MSELSERLASIEEKITALHDEARRAVSEAPHTDEYLPQTLDWHRDRYVLIRPDGKTWYGVPGFTYRQTGFQQRPAAFRAARSLPNCRIYDTRERTVIFDSDAA